MRMTPATQPPSTEAERLARENNYLAGELTRLEETVKHQMLTEYEVAYIRDRMRADENAAWLWQQIRRHAPWVITIGSLIGTAIVWLVTHSINIGPKP
jgi:hypothetical protein